jgi:acetyl/propionyl-CoA carboxylase alpha subunit
MKAVRGVDLPGAIAQARREADAAFGDGTLYVERLVTKPRHVEFRVLGDSRHGGAPVRAGVLHSAASPEGARRNAVHGGHPGARARMEAAAVAGQSGRLCQRRDRGVSGRGRGDSASFYFLEMNARLQVGIRSPRP